MLNLRFIRFLLVACPILMTGGQAIAIEIPECPGLLPKASYQIKLRVHASDQRCNDAELFGWLRHQLDTPLAGIAALQIQTDSSIPEYKTAMLVIEGPIWSLLLVAGLRFQIERFERNFPNSRVECVTCRGASI